MNESGPNQELSCEDNCNECGFTAHKNQPFGVEIMAADGIFVKQMFIPDAGTYVPQHSHKYNHLSMLAMGQVRVWADGVLMGDYLAPHGFHIPKGVKHTFMSLTPGTIIYCIHRLHGTKEVEIQEEHHLVEA